MEGYSDWKSKGFYSERPFVQVLKSFNKKLIEEPRPKVKSIHHKAIQTQDQYGKVVFYR